jgi:hypothetical protein
MSGQSQRCQQNTIADEIGSSRSQERRREHQPNVLVTLTLVVLEQPRPRLGVPPIPVINALTAATPLGGTRTIGSSRPSRSRPEAPPNLAPSPPPTFPLPDELVRRVDLPPDVATGVSVDGLR